MIQLFLKLSLYFWDLQNLSFEFKVGEELNMKKIVEKVWDYTRHAKFYEYRPNYRKESIAMLAALMSFEKSGYSARVADIGAGTGNLSIMLLDLGLKVDAIEPNDSMREIGLERTKGQNIQWYRETGTDTGLESGQYDWVTFGSSFNVMDRSLALKEAHRLLRHNGWFSCLWNHRDLHDPIQSEVEDIIKSFIPNYSGGTRREDQRPILVEHKDLFDNIIYLEQDFCFDQTIETYLYAWKSVKNPYWDLNTQEGTILFQKISDKIRESLPKNFKIKYVTRSWSARRRG